MSPLSFRRRAAPVRALCSGAGSRRGLDRNGLDSGVELEVATREIIEGAFVFEEDDLAERLTACLQPDAELIHRHIADVLALLVGVPCAMSCTDAQAAFADGRKHRVRIAFLEELALSPALLKSAIVSSYSSANAAAAARNIAAMNINAESLVFMD